MAENLPDFDQLWDYDNPAETETRFRQLLPQADQSGDTAYHAELLTQIARTLGLQRKFDEAHGLLDAVEKLLDAGLKRAQVRYLLERGRAFNSGGSPEKAQPLFIDAWERARQQHEDFYAVDAAHMVAIVMDGQDALDWNLRALELANASSEQRARNWRGSLYNNIGWTYHDMDDYETALQHFQGALQFREEEGKPNLIRIARWCIARGLRSLGRVEEALSMHQALLAEYEELGEQPGYTYEELGECLYLLGQADEARKYFALAYDVLAQDPWLANNEAERLQRLQELSR